MKNVLYRTWMLTNSYFNSTYASILNTIAVLKLNNHKLVPILWHNDMTQSLRQAGRRAELKWKRDKLQISYEIMRNSLTMVQRAAAKCKRLSELITKNSHKPVHSHKMFFFPPLTCAKSFCETSP